MPSEPITLRAWVRGSKASQAGGGTGGGLERVYQGKERPGADRSVGQGADRHRLPTARSSSPSRYLHDAGTARGSPRAGSRA